MSPTLKAVSTLASKGTKYMRIIMWSNLINRSISYQTKWGVLDLPIKGKRVIKGGRKVIQIGGIAIMIEIGGTRKDKGIEIA